MRIEVRDFNRIKDYMLKNYGLNLENKTTLIEGRLSNQILKSGFGNFHDYVEYVLSDPSEEQLNLLVSKLTTNYTFFMREPQHYEFLTGVALPELKKKIKSNELKIWSAGCSSGEEPYTIAMTVSRFLDSQNEKWNTRILATDISENMLSQASTAVYSDMQLKNIGSTDILKYFKKISDNKYQVCKELQNMVKFEKFNLMNGFNSFNRRFHIIFCRNVMIYFKNETKQELAKKFYNLLEPGGYLIIGLSETLHNIDTNFLFVKPAIYQKSLN